MSKVIVSVMVLAMVVSGFGVASAKSEVCEVVAVSSNDTLSAVLINCEPDVKMVSGDKVKVKVQNAKTSQIEGC